MAVAHSKNDLGVQHDLVAHLQEVARLAASYAAKFGAADLAYWAGLWHDLGKFHPAFQAYLENPSVCRGPDHKGAGAFLASKCSEPLAFVVAGHHGGLPSHADLKNRLREKAADTCTGEALQIARAALPNIEPSTAIPLPQYKSKIEFEFLLRVLFSALVDADFLDTERHFSPEEAARRVVPVGLQTLWERFEENQRGLTARRTDPVNRARHEVYLACLRAATERPGFFRLTVPTGGGKTRSGLAFGLQHALVHGMARVIVGIPYTSIIDQTADEYRKILGAEAVLEHHSAVRSPEDEENPPPEEVWRRLAAENWDAPIIVTTTVQLFESLFSNQTSSCRKLHNIARSVLILDEVQTLPVRLLEPILDALLQLVSHYGVTAVLCTATQPALDNSPYMRGLPDVREIVPDASRLFAGLKRVQYEWPQNGKTMTWSEVALEMRKQARALAVVNTKADAMALLDALDDPDARHLSTLLCGAHRLDTLELIKDRLRRGETCRVVSTQVVEAGVDVDFPMVLRALGPLDRIVQAAGRCNREGRMSELGRVLVFAPRDGARLPQGEYRSGTDTSVALMQSPDFSFDDPSVYEKYFRWLYQVVDRDAERIQALRERLDFPEVNVRFRMIEDDTVPVVVKYEGLDGRDESCREKVERLKAQLRRCGPGEARALLRKLQHYMVNVRSALLPDYQRDGLVAGLRPGVYEWLGKYDPIRGLVPRNREPQELVI